MSITLLEVPIDAVLEDLHRFPDKDQSVIVDHLTHFASKDRMVGSIGVAISHGKIFVIRHHKYIVVVRRLGIAKISAAVESSDETTSLSEVAKSVGGDIVVETAVGLKAIDCAPSTQWYVLFFCRALSIEERENFAFMVQRFFDGFKEEAVEVFSDFTFHSNGTCVEFKGYAPRFDGRRMAEFRRILIEFSRDMVKIISFNGRVFDDGIS
jgi:hypothetical protein